MTISIENISRKNYGNYFVYQWIKLMNQFK